MQAVRFDGLQLVISYVALQDLHC